ncbi:hypothetical protein P3G55_16500 [Leptospira sp. 96542]|nr:hypothetical protein [Leptospira sp. 96542]
MIQVFLPNDFFRILPKSNLENAHPELGTKSGGEATSTGIPKPKTFPLRTMATIGNPSNSKQREESEPNGIVNQKNEITTQNHRDLGGWEKWFSATKNSHAMAEEWKPLWNFLFPELGWPAWRGGVQDENGKDRYEWTLQKTEGGHSFHLIIQSETWGKLLFCFLAKMNEENPKINLQCFVETESLVEELKFAVLKNGKNIFNKLGVQTFSKESTKLKL